MNKVIKIFWASCKVLFFTMLSFMGLYMLTCGARKGFWWLHFISALFLFIFSGWLISKEILNLWKTWKEEANDDTLPEM